MTLFDLHIELAETNRLLARIADALEQLPKRRFREPRQPGEHPLVGIADISRMTPARASQVSREREEEQVARSIRFASEGMASRASTEPSAPQTEASVTGLWDFDDTLDFDPELEGHRNHPGG